MPTYQQTIVTDEGEILYVPPGVEVPGVPPDVRRKPWQYPPRDGALLDGGALAGSAEARRRLYDQYPPHIFPPIDAYVLDLPLTRAPGVVFAAGASGALVVWPVVPLGMRGVVRKFGFVVIAGLIQDARVFFRINQAPVQPFPGVVGAIGTLEVPQDTQCLLAPGDLFDVFVRNVGGAPVTVLARTYGWWWTDV